MLGCELGAIDGTWLGDNDGNWLGIDESTAEGDGLGLGDVLGIGIEGDSDGIVDGNVLSAAQTNSASSPQPLNAAQFSFNSSTVHKRNS